MIQENCIAIYDCDKKVKQHRNCIYMYVNLINEKKYVGQAKDLLRRHSEHMKRKEGQVIDKAIAKYGAENFSLLILKEGLETQDEINKWETHYIELYDTLTKNGKGYNISSGGSKGNTLAGKTEEELKEIMEKRSASRTGKYRGENNHNWGKKLSDETKRKIGEANSKYRGEAHPLYGRKLSEDHRRKISEANKGKPGTRLGMKNSEEHNRKIGEANRRRNLGRTHSEEARQKISEALKGENNYLSKKTIALNLTTGEYEEFCCSRECTEALEKKHNRKYQTPYISEIRNCNHNVNYSKAVGKNGDRRRMWAMGKGEERYTFFFKEDFESLIEKLSIEEIIASFIMDKNSEKITKGVE